MTVLEKIIAHKRVEIEALHAKTSLNDWIQKAKDAAPVRDFVKALKGAPPIRLIAEVKRASPSQGIIRSDFDPALIATAYATAGANCISVLTDEQFFQGSLHDLVAVRSSIDLPILRKDFILDPIQIWQARACGADAVLLIAECLDQAQLEYLYETTSLAGMTALVELYEEVNIDRVQRIRPRVVGVNNRNLRDFQIDLRHAIRLRKSFERDQIFVAESGIKSSADVRLLESHDIDAMLVGQSLCEQPDVAEATRTLLAGRATTS
ncbi:MAG TPA: indole-3-glycerol phosphate synthase TrpC [Pirellulaceae bacterium]|nr:indole-3-glycerol phosphate synthase TrpC [Pirellulaceae bacterium]HMO90671.1 indole-3-glycerol phosphate synthase TrpC [Pirellulaceae bacterium]HMP67750.1 indole-3-glycerol phosphate synthase TrpC [Pirellulaceae bacterium]